MSNIPVIRNLHRGELFSHRSSDKERLNAYFEGYLNESDANVLLGFDFAMEAVGNAIAYDLAEEDFSNLSLDYSKVDFEKVRRFVEDDGYDPFESADDEELSLLSTETKVLMVLYRVIIHRIEDARNSQGVSMIESMGDEEHEKNVKEFQNGTYKNILVRMSEV